MAGTPNRAAVIRALVAGARVVVRLLLPLAAAVGVVMVFDAFSERYKWSFALGSATVDAPARRYGYFLPIYMLLGSVAVYLFAVVFYRIASFDRLRLAVIRLWNAVPDWAWLVGLTVLAVWIPVHIRADVLLGMPLTDDESAYRFMARLISTGQLYAPGHEAGQLLDRPMMVNDGRMYATHPLGWSALLAPGIWIGRPGNMAALYGGLGVPALFLILRRLAGSAWAKLGTVLYVASPMIMVGAATELPVTSSLVALLWLHWFALRCWDPRDQLWCHAGVAVSLGFAFMICPLAALGGGVGVLAYWALSLRQRSRRRAGLATLTVLAVALLFVSAFWVTNAAQTGAGWKPAHLHALSSELEHGDAWFMWGEMIRHHVQWWGGSQTLATLGLVLYRLNIALFGWVASLLFVPFAIRVPEARLAWLSLAGLLAVFLLTGPVGVDAFGPLNYFEVAWPVLVLTVLGVRAITQSLEPGDDAGAGSPSAPASSIPLALMLALSVTGHETYRETRMKALKQISKNTRKPLRNIHRARLRNAVVFGARSFVPRRCQDIPRTYLTAPPNNFPDLSNGVIWLNAPRRSRRSQREIVMAAFPERSGYVFKWLKNCRAKLTPISALERAEPEPAIDDEPPPDVKDEEEQDEAEQLLGASAGDEDEATDQKD